VEGRVGGRTGCVWVAAVHWAARCVTPPALEGGAEKPAAGGGKEGLLAYRHLAQQGLGAGQPGGYRQEREQGYR